MSVSVAPMTQISLLEPRNVLVDSGLTAEDGDGVDFTFAKQLDHRRKECPASAGENRQAHCVVADDLAVHELLVFVEERRYI